MTSYQDPTWSKASKLAALVVIAGVAWACVPSKIFLRPISMAVVKDEADRWTMVSERETPYGAVNVETQAEIQVLGREEGLTCTANLQGVVLPKDRNIARYDITNWAEDCLNAGPPISLTFRRTVRIAGVIPLRPVIYSFTINPETAPVIPTEGE